MGNRAAPKSSFGKTISSYSVGRGLPNFTKAVLLEGSDVYFIARYFPPRALWSEVFSHLFRQGGEEEFPPCPESSLDDSGLT